MASPVRIAVFVLLCALAACGDNLDAPGPRRIIVSPQRVELRVGETSHVSARYATFAGETPADDLAWASSDPARATVIGDGAGATITALATGDVTITAEGRALSAAIELRISPAMLVGIAVSPTQPALAAGTTAQLAATAMYSDGTTADVTAAAVWTSDREGIATVFQGLVRGRAPGDATITARFNSRFFASTRVTVGAPLLSIAIAPADPDVALGADHPFTATATFTDLSTADVTDQVAWSSTNALVATISNAAGSRGIADALEIGTTTITATLGALSDATQLTVFLAPVGPWVAEPGFAGVLGCADGVKFSMASDLVYVCTTAAGVMRGAIAGTAIAWSSPNTGISNLMGQAIAAHTVAASTMMYMGAPQPGVDNWFRSNDAAATFTPSLLLDSAGNPRSFYAGRFQPMIGNILASWDPGTATPQAVVVTGGTPPTTVRVIAGATGTTRSITGSAANNLYVGVFGETPAGAPAIGGVFRSTNSGATWAAQDNGIAAADKHLVFSVVIDPGNAAVLYAGLRGGGRVYKTTDAGATWTASAMGIPAKARVTQLLISPQSASTLHAATNLGLYRSTNAGATWTLAGFQGRAIRGVAQSGADGALILVAVDDGMGLYRAM